MVDCIDVRGLLSPRNSGGKNVSSSILSAEPSWKERQANQPWLERRQMLRGPRNRGQRRDVATAQRGTEGGNVFMDDQPQEAVHPVKSEIKSLYP